MNEETEFKRWFRKNYQGWSESYEPGHGGGIGIPDIQILRGGVLVPIEMKVGNSFSFRDSMLLQPRNIRPAQISWHKRFKVAGGLSFFYVGVKTGTTFWSIYELPDIDTWWMDASQSFNMSEVSEINIEDLNDEHQW